MLVRAADLIGQLGDPSYLRKANALFCEFRETGVAKALGYASPADVIEKYPDFFWRSVSPYIAPAVQFLEVTVDGRTWLANLYANVFSALLIHTEFLRESGGATGTRYFPDWVRRHVELGLGRTTNLRKRGHAMHITASSAPTASSRSGLRMLPTALARARPPASSAAAVGSRLLRRTGASEIAGARNSACGPLR